MKSSFDKTYDVVVVGGGIAGVAAAVAAAREGAQTALLEKSVYLGGLATTGIICLYLPLCDGNGRQVSFGLAEELLYLGQKYGPGEIPGNWKNQKNASRHERFELVYNPASMILALDEIISNENIDVWFDSVVSDVLLEENSIKAVEVCNKSGKILIGGKCFVDATGDADLIFYAKHPYHTQNNKLAFCPLEYNVNSNEDYFLAKNLKCRLMINEESERFNGIDGKKVTDFVLASRKKYLEQCQKEWRTGTDKTQLFPLFLPAMSQFRTTRSVHGVFTLSDKMNGVEFDDSIGMVAEWRHSGPVWEIPYRCLIPERMKNILVAGRCVSSEKDAWEITRVIPTAAVTGEASGTAAALAVEKSCSPSELDVGILQERLQNKNIPLFFHEIGL
jgi:hypothetical protein